MRHIVVTHAHSGSGEMSRQKTRAQSGAEQSGAAGQKRTPSASARGGAVKLDTLVNLCERLYRGSGKWSVMMPRKLVLQ